MISHYIKKINIGLLATLLILFIWISALLLHTNRDIESKIIDIITSNAGYFTANVSDVIKKKIPSPPLFDTLKENPQLREELEENIQMLVTPSFKYVYILYRGEDGMYRYLLDGSKEEKGAFNDLLNVDKQRWDQVYTTKKMEAFRQQSINALSITFLTPILYGNHVEAVIAIDFSSSLLHVISTVVEPVKQLLILMIVVALLLFISVIIQIVSNYLSKKEMMIDPLTQTYNRYFLKDFFKKNSFQNYTIAIADVDHFKKINDIYGHHIGDMILYDIAKIIQKNLRKQDALVRFGGEEFLIIVKNDISHTQILKRLNTIKTEIEKYHFTYKDSSIVSRSTISMGVVFSSSHFKNISDVIKYADTKLYKAKREGRNKIIHLCDDQKPDDSLMPIEDIKLALDEERVFCEFQPIINLQSGEIQKYEALVRILKKDNTIVYPDRFLSSITQTNIYIELTKRVLEMSLQVIKQKKICISINLSLSDIVDNVIYENLLNLLQNNRQYTEFLSIELLEYENLVLKIITDRINTIRQLGVKVALDDFGTGYSNLEALKEISIDILKIDAFLIKDIDTSEKSKAIVKSICMVAQQLSIITVAEFVHSQAVLEVCKEIGIDMGQGFFIGKPKKLSEKQPNSYKCNRVSP